MKTLLIIFGIIFLTACSFSSKDTSVISTNDKASSVQTSTAVSPETNDLSSQKQEETHVNQAVFSASNVEIHSENFNEPTTPIVPEKSVQLMLQTSGTHVEMFLSNPKKISIQSVRTWLAFPVNMLEIKNLNLNTEVFDLAAPGEYLVDIQNGIIKIGLASTSGNKNESIFIGSFDAFRLNQSSVPITCYDYSDLTNSHCTVLGIEQKNILQEPMGIIMN